METDLFPHAAGMTLSSTSTRIGREFCIMLPLATQSSQCYIAICRISHMAKSQPELDTHQFDLQ